LLPPWFQGLRHTISYTIRTKSGTKGKEEASTRCERWDREVRIELSKA
jgi:hypothetical protein